MQTFIEESKRLFKTFDKLYTLDICTPCCVDPTYEKLLRNSKRFEVSAAAIYEYNSSAKAGYTIETSAELKYFAPRILELLIQEAEIHHSSELFLDRFNNVPKTAWTDEELAFFQDFASAYWSSALYKEKFPYKEDAIAILIMLSKLPIDLSVLLNDWSNRNTLVTLIQFADFYLHELNWKRSQLNNGFAEKEFSNEVTTFFLSEKTKEKIIKQIENTFWVKEIKLTAEQDNVLNSLYIILKNN